MRCIFLIVLLPSVALAAETVSLYGQVRWTGNLRRFPEVARIGHDPACPKGAHRLVERKGRRLAGVAVWLTPIGQPAATTGGQLGEATPLMLDEARCGFAPRMSVVAPGTTVTVWNQDPRRHWLVVEGQHVKRRQLFHQPGATAAHLRVAASDRIRFWSGLHRWMEAWVIAVDTPWRAVTDGRGRFAFTDVPAGDYILHTWHPALGEQTEILTLPAVQETTIRYERVADRPDPALRLAIPQLHEEWRRPRGDIPFH